jgi:hypothetical protein
MEGLLTFSRLPSSSTRTILCLSPHDLKYLLGEIRELTDRYKAGQNPDSFQAFRKLIELLLHLTVMDHHSTVCLVKGPRKDKVVSVLEGRSGEALRLNDGRFLRLNMALSLEDTEKGPRVKVKSSDFQYQMDKDNNIDSWIFRYDYVRELPAPHPYAHLHIRGSLIEQCLVPS